MTTQDTQTIENKVLSIADLDVRTPSGEGAEIEVKRADGSGTGVFIRVLGEQSEVVEKHQIDRTDARTAEIVAARAQDKSGQAGVAAVSARTIMNDEIESAVVRTAGWRGLAEQFSVENARRLYTLNRSIARQVIAASNNEALFTKA